MEPADPLSQLASCCFGRRQRSDGFKTQAIRNQLYYSPSMAPIGPRNTTTWPMAAVGPFSTSPIGFIAAANQPSPLTQPYILCTQPIIMAGNQNAQAQTPQGSATMALVQHSKSSNGQMQTISFVGTQPSPIHRLHSLIGSSQYAIYSNSISAVPGGGIATQTYTTARHPLIYECPRVPGGRMIRNRSNYLGPIAESSCQSGHDQQNSTLSEKSLHQQQRPRSLNSEIYRRLELIEKQIDLTRDLDLVERHGIVTTRAIDAHSLAPYLTDEIFLRYQEQFLFGDDYVIRFIEIIKRPGQTLGLYIRLVHFENQLTKSSREGIVITKIESNSPVYTSRVLNVGDEIISINLIDIQGMSLDDVVTLMSIPKRLVLALRIPKERDLQLDETFSHGLDQTIDNARSRRADDESQYNQQGRLASGQQFNQEFLHAGTSQNRPVPLNENFGPESMRSVSFLGQSASQSNFSWESTSMRQNFQTINNNHTSPNGHLAQPVRVHSEIHMNDVVAGDRKGNTSHAPLGHLSERDEPSMNRSIRQMVRGSPPNESTKDDRRHCTPTNSTINLIERQMATTLSMDEHHDESDRFRNFSVDPEIATLEREAMNKERHTMHVRDVISDHLSYRADISENLGTNLFPCERTSRPITSNVPRRTLPSRPDMSSISPGAETDSTSISRKPVLNNIRLGETPEQSSYFSTSIEAINREFKELRQQRMAISNNDDPGT